MLEAGTQTNNRLGTLASIINKSKQNTGSSSSNSSLKGGCARWSKFTGTTNFDHDLYDALKFVIKTFVDEHYNCPGARLQNSAADSHFIANIIAAKVKEKPDYPAYEIVQDVNRTHRVQVSYWQAYPCQRESD